MLPISSPKVLDPTLVPKPPIPSSGIPGLLRSPHLACSPSVSLSPRALLLPCTWSPPIHCCLGNREQWEPAAGFSMFQ